MPTVNKDAMTNLPESISSYDQAFIDQEAQRLLGQLTKLKSVTERVKIASEQLLGKPYVLGALGEGPSGEFDQNPLYRFDAFDCLTFVSTVLALAHARDLESFGMLIRRINYEEGVVSYQTRNHFMSCDWNINNMLEGFIEDITQKIQDEQKISVSEMANALIDKPSWLLKRDFSNIKLLKFPGNNEVQKLLGRLHALSTEVSPEVGRIFYLPFNRLFVDEKPNLFLFSQIPDASIVEIVRPNWDLAEQIGTRLNVSHLGFVFWEERQLIFRHTSKDEGKVVDIPLVDYLQRFCLKSDTIKGINLQKILS